MRARTVLPLLLLLAIAGASGSAAADTPAERDPNEPIEVPDEEAELAELGLTVCQCAVELEDNGVTPAGPELRACVVDRFWPTTEFPPIEADPASVKAAWALVTTYVQAYLDAPDAFKQLWCTEAPLPDPPVPPGPGPDIVGPETVEPPGPLIPGFVPTEEGPGPVDFQEASSALEGYPWEIPLIHRGGDGKHAPTPGMFFIVNKSNAVAGLDTMLEIARYALGSAYAMAGAPRSLSSIPAEEVLEYLALITCSPWNDTAYGTDNEQASGGQLGIGPHGRGISMYPRHHNNIVALLEGRSPQRTTLINAMIDGEAPSEGDRWPQLWLPPINLELLRDHGVVSTAGEWSTGDGVIVPPPLVWAHGVYSRVAAPGAWGCN